ncbi:hypothetical protein PILCRDRAFT_827588 [Piloderma croceum F 1598]|uniref:Uncharacterized protein n=1 Tax=Piloderma croceum (strain F 1598) TaxID=765440 RepID=A0A0C3AMP9_PILCF|nr:hypothetical protein PILCRDRAFT_827588 [Piloderma croceum F 1598]
MVDQQDTSTPQATIPSARNPTGKNQYSHCPSAKDERVKQLIIGYHRRGITDRKNISQLLLAESPSIIMSEATVARRLKKFNLRASSLTTQRMPDAEKRQYILDQMSKDPTGKKGPRTIRKEIASEHGVFLTRDFVEAEVRHLRASQLAREEDPEVCIESPSPTLCVER